MGLAKSEGYAMEAVALFLFSEWIQSTSYMIKGSPINVLVR